MTPKPKVKKQYVMLDKGIKAVMIIIRNQLQTLMFTAALTHKNVV